MPNAASITSIASKSSHARDSMRLPTMRRPGDRLDVEIEDSRLILRRQCEDVVDELIALAPEIWHGIDTDRYVDELRNEWSDREL